jgi:hypothetical protein
MSLSRREIRHLRSAGWEVIEDGPAVELRRLLVAVFGRRSPARTAGR